MASYTHGYQRIASKEDVASRDLGIAQSGRTSQLRSYIHAVCDEIDWPSYRRLSAGDCMPWVEACTKEIMDRTEVESLAVSAPPTAIPRAGRAWDDWCCW
jgi:hypothetical protein